MLEKYYMCNFDENHPDIGEDEVIKSLWSGGWIDLLKEELINNLSEQNITQDAIKTLLEKEPEKYNTKELLNIGIVSLLAYCDHNWSPTPTGSLEKIKSFSWPCKKHVLSRLQRDSEDIDANIKFPELLLLAVEVFTYLDNKESILMHLWWLHRCKVIHQRSLDDISPKIYSELELINAKISNLLRTLNDHPRIQVTLLAEMSQSFLLYGRVQKAEEYLKRSKDMAGFKIELHGIMGKRTKFQQKELPQLALSSELDSKIQRPSAEESHGSTNLPKQISLQDDVRLDKVQYSEKNVLEKLPSLEQTLCLLTVQYLQKSQPRDELADEEFITYLEAILSQENGPWSTRVAALLIKCKLEANHKRTVERAMMQCEAIVNGAPDESTANQRLSYLWASGLAPCWRWRVQLADLYLSLGLVKAALDIYLNLQLFEEVIVCYTLLKMRQRAAEIIQQKIDINPTPKLFCLLGDATDDISYYERAWELSDHKSSRAQRHWATYLFNHKRYEECVPHFQKSLEINSLQENCWFRLGFAAMQVEDWPTSAAAYRRYTYLNPNSFEAWNNLARVYVKQGDKERAHKALIESLKFNYDNWKLWENVIAVSIDTGHFEDVIRGVHRILDIQGKYNDVEVLTLLVNAVVKGNVDADGNSASRLQKRTAELMGRVTSVHMSNPAYWRLYADVTADDLSKAQRLLKAYKGFTQAGDWIKNPETCKEVISLVNNMIEFTVEARKNAKESEKLQVDQQVSSVSLTGQAVLRAVEKEDWPGMDEHLNALKNCISILKI